MNSIDEKLISDLPQEEFRPKARCSFSSAVDEHIEGGLDLNQYLIKHPAATFFMRASGPSMCELGILDGDLLIVDKSLTPKDNSIVIAVINSQFTVRRLKLIEGRGFLHTTNGKPQAIIDLAQIDGFQFWGVVTHAIHHVCAN